MRRVIPWLLIMAFVWIVVGRQADIKRLADTLSHGSVLWIFAAVIVQIAYYITFTALYQAAFYTVGIKRNIRELLPVLLGSMFIGVVAPSAGVGPAAIFVDDAAQHGDPPARAVVGVLLQLVVDLAMFVFILVLGFAFLFSRHILKTYETVSAAVLIGLIFGLVLLLLMGLWLPELLQKILNWFQRVANAVTRFLRLGQMLEDDWAEEHAKQFSEAAEAIHAHPKRLGNTIWYAFASHLLDILTIFILFVAFGHPVSLGVLVAGYAIGILFWIVSPTPSGIGVVEGTMALVYTSLGVPSSTAIIVALAFRGLTFWLPILLGFFMIRGMKSFKTVEGANVQDVGVHVVAILVALVGAINVVSAVLPELAARVEILNHFLSESARHGARLAAALFGFGLIGLASGLWRRKHAAWVFSMLLLSASVVSHLLKGLDYQESGVAAVVAIWLWSLRHEFHAVSDRPSVKQGLVNLLTAIIFTLAYGTLGFYFLDRYFHAHYGFVAALRQTLLMFVQVPSTKFLSISGYGRYFVGSIYIVGGATIGYALFTLLRPVVVRHPEGTTAPTP